MMIDDLAIILRHEPSYRQIQAKKAVFQDLIDSWDEASVLPQSLRLQLKHTFPLALRYVLFPAKDKKTIKALLTLNDGLQIECVLMKYEDRNTVCVSSQVGCPLGCLFCATGKMGFKRNLTVDEIITQLLIFARLLKKEGEKISNLVFMGMGEPFLNYQNVLEAIKIINDPDCFGLGSRHISVSTSGIPEGIEKFKNETFQVNLAISLHAPNDELRSKLMPINRKYPLEEVIKAVKSYQQKTKRKVMFEYIMIGGLNDSKEHAENLFRLLKGIICVVNLIPYNPTGTFDPSSPKNINKFKNLLGKRGIETIIRQSFGQEIQGACGQLATTHK